MWLLLPLSYFPHLIHSLTKLWARHYAGFLEYKDTTFESSQCVLEGSTPRNNHIHRSCHRSTRLGGVGAGGAPSWVCQGQSGEAQQKGKGIWGRMKTWGGKECRPLRKLISRGAIGATDWQASSVQLTNRLLCWAKIWGQFGWRQKHNL